MSPPTWEHLTVGSEKDYEGALPTVSRDRLRTYDLLLTEWYTLSRRWGQLETSDGSDFDQRSAGLRKQLTRIRAEIDSLVDEFEDDEFDRVMQHVLKR